MQMSHRQLMVSEESPVHYSYEAERWQRIKQLCHSALEISASDRAAFLDQACDGDESLRREVETLLVHEEEAEHFIEEPAVEVAAKDIARDTAPSLIGRQIGHYQVLSLLGAGGMGEVYLARDTRLDRTVALKILPANVASDQDRMRRFVREARAASALNHPNVATIHDVGEADGVSFIVMENVEGQTLASMIEDHPTEPEEIIQIGLQVADALAEAHARGITHRDIKPANIMLTQRGQVKVLDFGLAKIARPEGQGAGSEMATALSTTPGLVMGTVQYMSPEQVLGGEVDHRSDIFSLGVVLYQMATGRRPFERPTPAETMAAILRDEPPTLTQIVKNLPPGLDGLVTQCLAKKPEARYQSARDLHYDLSALAGKSGIVRASSPAQLPIRSVVFVGTAPPSFLGLAVAAIYVSRGAGEKDPIQFDISLQE
jgi:serine/threonine protein kinase